MIKSTTNKIIVIITFFIFITISTTLIMHNVNKVDKMNYLNQTTQTPDEANKKVLNKIKRLQTYAESYKKENGEVISTTSLCFQFIRNGNYDSTLWQILLGTLDQDFISYVNAKEPGLYFSESDIIIDERTHKEIDFVHMIATLNTYYKYGEKVAVISTHYGGWAGDLVTLMGETISYRRSYGISSYTKIYNYANERLGTNLHSTFTSKDGLANFDGLNISKEETLATDLYTTLYNYYIENDNHSANNSWNRFKTSQEYLGTKESIKEEAKQLLANPVVLEALTPNTLEYVNEQDREILATVFSEYVYGSDYVKLNETNKEVLVGSTIQVPISEKNVVETGTINYDKSKLSVSIQNYIMYIKTLDYGASTIEIKNYQSKVIVTYNVSAKNKPPTIINNLQEIEPITENEKITINIKASGTNNVYSWYIVDKDTGEVKLIKETNKPSIELSATPELNGKYLKCGIKNEGNEEIFTSEVLLSIEKNTNEETKEENNKEDTNKENDKDNNNKENNKEENKQEENKDDNKEDNNKEDNNQIIDEGENKLEDPYDKVEQNITPSNKTNSQKEKNNEYFVLIIVLIIVSISIGIALIIRNKNIIHKNNKVT